LPKIKTASEVNEIKEERGNFHVLFLFS